MTDVGTTVTSKPDSPIPQPPPERPTPTSVPIDVSQFGQQATWGDLTPGQRYWFVNSYVPQRGHVLCDSNPVDYYNDTPPALCADTNSLVSSAAAAPASSSTSLLDSPLKWALIAIAAIVAIGLATGRLHGHA